MLREQRDQRILIEGQHKHKHKHKHHHHRGNIKGDDVYADSNVCLWIFLVFVVLVIVFWIVAAVVWPYEPYGPYGPGPGPWHKEEGSSEEPFVFRKRHIFAEKRMHRSQCTAAGEEWSAELGMCVPKFNAPLALEHAIFNITTPACSSFYHAMCGKWISQHRNEDRTFSYAYHRNQRQIERLIAQAPAETSPLARFHRSCAELTYPAAIKESELEFRHVMEMVAGDLKSYADLPSTFGRLARYGYGGPFVLSIERHPLEPRMVPMLVLDDTFRNFSSAHLTGIFNRAQHLTHWDTRFTMDRVRRTLKVLNALNEHAPVFADEWSYEEYVRAGGFRNDSVRFAELPIWHTPYADRGGWTNYFQSLDGSGLRFAGAQTVWLLDAKQGGLQWLLQSALPNMELLDWRSYVEFSIIYHCHQFVPLLPHNVYFKSWDVAGPLASLPYAQEAEYRFHHRIPRANLSIAAPSVEQCYGITQYMLPGHTAAAFLAQQDPIAWTTVKEKVRSMTTQIIERFVQLVLDTPWLSDAAARNAALAKLQAMRVRVAEPDEWEVEPFASRISGDRYDHNLNLIRRYRVHRNLQQWHKDVPDSLSSGALSLFGMPLSDVNAFYSASQNSITILAGILQRPFYDAAYDEVSLAALLGSVIGHEVSHALDSHGLRWNSEGVFEAQSIYGNASASMAGFATAVRCVVEEFGPAPVACTNRTDLYGYGTLNEDISDLTGVKLAYHALFDARPELGLGAKQHFWMIFAQMWCASYDDEHMCDAVEHDEHAIPLYRVDRTLRNMPEFHRDYACHAGTAMHRPAEQTCKVYG